MSRFARLGVLVAVAAILVTGWAGVSDAHPLGNFTVNTYSGLTIGPNRVSVDFVLDMAEIPAFQAKQTLGVSGSEPVGQEKAQAFRSRECDVILARVSLRADDHPVALRVASTSLAFPPGQAGLTTLRLTCSLLGTTDRSTRLVYRSDNFTDRVGWREITAVGDRMTLVGSDVPASSISARLTAYPADLLLTPLDQRQASMTLRAGGAALSSSPAVAAAPGPTSPLPRGVDQATQAFTSFVGRQHFSLPFALVAVLLSGLLGAIHALAPGHGKTVMAAYLVGQRGSFRQAAMIALTVTLTHTAGVLLLGIAISTSLIIAPERLYPWLGLASGIMLLAIGLSVLIRVLRLRSHHHRGGEDRGHGHDHGEGAVATIVESKVHAQPHFYGGRRHSHGPLGGHQPVTWSNLLAMGFVGGFLPSPSAVVVLLGAIALGRSWFGVLLVVAYGAGMAATLTGAGLLLLHARDALDRRFTRIRESWLAHLSRLLPIGTAVVIIGVGAYLSLRAATLI
jgi:ABC-type nickel/cobalt efflux system permease component RcnA